MYSNENAEKLLGIVNEKVDRLVFETSVIYGILLDMDRAGVDYARLIDIDRAENAFKAFSNLAPYMEKRRQDLYFSDREIKSLAYVLYAGFDDELIKSNIELDKEIGLLTKYELI